MGIVSSGVKKLTRGAVKKTANKTAVKAAKKTAYPAERKSRTHIYEKAGLALGVVTPFTFPAQYAIDEMKRSEKRAKEARARLATGEKKFGSKGRR